ncbi:MAG TPA: RNase adapter RapZ [Rhodopila sp.]|uniref:RNase adapter RapZ n=1 Tax=Rhodopila sp. TaxID=2480087 RepID=UPI002C149524|nr:RNase adapter RapZ [Rhodopila sp.]HVY18157.1 RNase adapter RapZ [Rhodopila sp.]
MSEAPRLSVVIVTGLSGAGKASVLRALEDVGYEAVDNLPLPMLEETVARGDRRLAVGIDARTRGFVAEEALATITRLRENPTLNVHLVYVWADETTLLRRYTESRRRHPLAPQGRVADGVTAEIALTSGLRGQADLLIDTSQLPVAQLRRLVERHFGNGTENAEGRMIVSLMSFAFPKGLPQEADLVFDARFLRNPYYDPILRPLTGMQPEVGAYVEADPDFQKFFTRLADLVDFVLPRFVQEGKKYATITIGCTGGQHRSVFLIEKLATYLLVRTSAEQAGSVQQSPWRVYVTHRELARDGKAETFLMDRPVARRDDSDLDKGAQAFSVRA